MSRTGARALRVVASLVLLGALILMLPRGELERALLQVSLLVLATSLVTFVVCHVAAAYKWRMLMGTATDLSFGRAVRAHFTGLVGNLSPLGMVAGDLVRAGTAMRGSAQSSTIVLTSVVDRVVDTAALLVLALAGFLWLGGRSSMAVLVLWGGFAMVVAGGGALLAGHALLRRSHHPRLAGLRDAADVLAARPALIARALILSVCIQGTLLTTNAFIGSSVGVESSFGAWLLAWPVAKLVAYLPVGVAGIGVREAALVALLGPFGGAPGTVMAAGLLWDGVLIVGSVGGWLLLSVRHATGAAAARPIHTP